MVNAILNDNSVRTAKPTTNPRFVKIPFHHYLAPKIKRLFHNPNHNIQIAFYNTKTNKTFFNRNIKDKTDIKRQANVVYEIPCNCGRAYIGQTSQYVKKRLGGHKGDIKSGEEATGLSSHILNSDGSHHMLWDQVKILHKESFWEKRAYLEAFQIAIKPNNINNQLDFRKCNNIYRNILNNNQPGSRVLFQIPHVSDLATPWRTRRLRCCWFIDSSSIKISFFTSFYLFIRLFYRYI